jgi:hypothetical protein
MIKHVIPTRAIENTVYVVAADRVGSERGFTFAGQSCIVDVSGKTLSGASNDKEEIIYSDVNLEIAREKHLISIPGEYEVHRIKDRRPELYGVITEPVDGKKPGIRAGDQATDSRVQITKPASRHRSYRSGTSAL